MKNNPNNFFYPKKLYYIHTSSHQRAVNKEKPKKCLLDEAVNKGKKKFVGQREIIRAFTFLILLMENNYWSDQSSLSNFLRLRKTLSGTFFFIGKY